MRIFISYRRSDSAGHAGRLYDALAEHFGRDHVFMDLSAIDSGQNFVDAIDAAVRSCDALVAIIGDDWVTSAEQGGRRLDQPGDFVRSEIAAALARGIPVFPVLVEGTTMPAAEALPDVLKPLAKRQAHELSDRRWSYDVDSLIHAIEKLGGKRHGMDRRTRLALAAAAVLLVVAASVLAYRMLPGASGDLANADQYAERAAQRLARGEYDRAIADFDRALALDPRPEHYYNRGLAHFSKNDVDRAIADWNLAIGLDPADAPSYRQRGNAYFTKGDYTRAEADYNRAIELDPRNAKAFYNRGLLFQARDERTRAVTDFTTVVTLAADADTVREAKARLSQLQTAPGSATGAAAPDVTLDGEWTAEVTYSWGDKHPERFAFKQDGGDVFGTASYLRVRRGILDGTLKGNVVQFRTQTETMLGNETRPVTHRYRGRVTGNTIAFVLQSESAGSSESIEFTATRLP